MKKFKIVLHGRNFLLNFDGDHKKFGFHATRYVQAESREEAERIAVIQIHQYHAIKDTVSNEGTDSPVVQVTDAQPINFFKSLFTKTSNSFSFYPEENEQGMRRVSGPHIYE